MQQAEGICVVKAVTVVERERCFGVRRGVFIGEQNIAQELVFDSLDSGAVHYLVLQNGEPVATVRAVLKDGGKTAKIGRLAVIKKARGQGLAKVAMNAIEADHDLKGAEKFVLDSQSYIVPLYKSLGYEVEGEEFIEVGIPHRHMSKKNARRYAACQRN
ncbi:MAG: GNAT family N-acetyltransferase [Alphaproteobacteria bacterium]|nr:GNAT family N-acetyltransferase [Alphaproteobacteria bacterium]